MSEEQKQRYLTGVYDGNTNTNKVMSIFARSKDTARLNLFNQLIFNQQKAEKLSLQEMNQLSYQIFRDYTISDTVCTRDIKKNNNVICIYNTVEDTNKIVVYSSLKYDTSYNDFLQIMYKDNEKEKNKVLSTILEHYKGEKSIKNIFNHLRRTEHILSNVVESTQFE